MTTDIATNAARTTGFRSLASTLFEQWTALWNGETDLATRIVTPDFRISLANAVESAATDDLRGPRDLARFVADHRASIPGLHYRLDGEPVVDEATGRITCRWTVTFPDASGTPVAKSGIDVLAVTDGRIREVWSVTGLRVFASAG
ncbi:nuclear transport factor 2 family protein [Streptomyces spororaveus]|uniref:nuclear transport factor 2 family protein n=1 Tax=Streptomyces spororaveus TaxID=284039 RepID=UPI003673A4DC